jgi:gliding motility-associated-like protein
MIFYKHISGISRQNNSKIQLFYSDYLFIETVKPSNKPLLLLSLFLIIVSIASAQSYQWAFKIGSSSDDVGRSIYTDNNGFVYVVGYFKGSNIDFDPGVGSALLSSNGDKDGFIAKYTTAGQYVWAFKIGGSNLDEVNAISVDPSGNVYITGYFRGVGVDFDPGAGSSLLNSNGEGGGDPGYGGDIFIAKYNSSGQYQWAFNIGGTTLGDNGMVLATDNAGNVYTSGYFRESPDFNPGAGVNALSASSGTMYLVKYNTAGQYQWGFNLGQGDVDNSSFGIKVDASANVYLTGYFQGSNQDFDPSPTTTALINSNGSFEAFVAKYNSNGQYQWAFPIGGPNVDVGRDIEVDNNGNVYVAGDFDGFNVDFNPSPIGTAFFNSNNRDVFVAKYNSAGQYQWAKRFGASGADISWSLAFTNNNLYITGSFQGTINFDPAGTDNLSSNGGNDFFITKFDVNGNYVCAFTVGGTGNDDAYRIDADNSGNLYTTGLFSSSNADFNPSTSLTNTLSTTGSSDIFFAKYSWADNVLPVGSLGGNTVQCTGQGQLTFNATAGTGPFIIQYSNGTSTYTQTNVQSGVPFNVNPNPTTTTTYTLVSIKGSEKCPSVNYPTGITGTISVNSGNFTDFSYSQNPCATKTIQFTNLTPNTSTITWDFGNSTTNTGSSSPTVTYANYGSYPVKLKVQTTSGCIDSVIKIIPVNVQQDSLIAVADTTICRGNSIQLNTLPALNFCWASSPTLSNTSIANPVATPTANTTYYFTSQTTGTNLVLNGDFSSGNTGFTSDHTSQFPNTTEGVYWIGNNSASWNINFNNCTEHTTGTGNMMMVNGSSVIGAKVWSQTVTVVPNTNYAFSVWIESLAALNPANLRFAINGNLVGNNINAGNIACQWSKFFATWNSGNTTSATITIVNNNTIANGNDFALDDISFAQVFLKQDSVKVTVVDPPTVSTGVGGSVCAGQSLQLSASGANFYSWSPAAGLSNTNIANPIASPLTTTQYTVTGYNVPGCTNTSLVTVNVLPGITPDFSYTQNICDPKTVQFSNLTQNTTSVQWDFGNSTTNNSSQNPSVTYTTYGTYQVKLKVQSSSFMCVDSVVKTIPVTIIQDSLISVNDTTICKGTSLQLITLPNLNFCWNPSQGLSNTNVTNPVATPTTNTTYYFTSQTTGANLVANGDFTNGNTGFSSDYTSQFPNTSQGVYWIGNNSASWNINFNNCTEHTTGTGNMMMVNGSSVSGSKVWSQTVTVVPNTNYAFSIWIESLAALNPANLRFSINGNLVGNNINAGNIACQWSRFFATWNSGNTTSATITIVNNNTIANGNDFALDDISFAPVFLKQDSIKVTVTDPPALTITPATTLCQGDSLPLNVSGASIYSWSPSTGLTNAAIPNPVAAPTTTTKYIVSGYDLPGCTGKDSVTITVNPKPVITKIKDTSFCTGSGSITIFASAPGATQYVWSPAAGLSSTSISNPIANPGSTQTYHVQVTGSNGCKNNDSVKVSVLSVPTVDVRQDTTICNGIATTLYGTSSGGSAYSWNPITGLSNPNILNPVASPSVLTKYILTVSNASCLAKDSVTIGVIPSPMVTKSNDTTICNEGQAQLVAGGGTSYLWSPATGLSNPNIYNPLASPSLPVKYFVVVTGSNGCFKQDSVKVDWIPKPTFTISPATAAICKGTPTILTAGGADTYNWYAGSNIASSNTAATSVNPAATNQYSVAVHHNFCRISDTLQSTVTVNPLPTVTVNRSNDIDCSNASAILTAIGGSSYSWTPTIGMTGVNTSTPMVSPVQTTTYTVKVTDANNCFNYDSVMVVVAFNPVTGGYNMPNAFTPNNDGRNDCFGLKYWGGVIGLEFNIYNRWGEVIFRSNNTSACWDGSYKGISQPSGTYVYQIKARTACGEVYRKGTVVLVR